MDHEVQHGLLLLLMLNEGIVPIEGFKGASEPIARFLAQLTPDDARRARRCFRKAWRKEARPGRGAKARRTQLKVGYGVYQPTALHVHHRKMAVLMSMLRRVDDTLAQLPSDRR